MQTCFDCGGVIVDGHPDLDAEVYDEIDEDEDEPELWDYAQAHPLYVHASCARGDSRHKRIMVMATNYWRNLMREEDVRDDLAARIVG
jgi:hypothetical protein